MKICNRVVSNPICNSKPKVAFNSIPTEIFHKYIFPHLEHTSLISLARTNKEIQNEVINYLIDIHCKPTILFANFLAKKLEQIANEKFSSMDAEHFNSQLYADEIDLLINLKTYISSLEVKFIEIKHTLPKLKRGIIHVLKKLETNTLNLLKPLVVNYLLRRENLSQFKNIFQEVECYKKLEDVKTFPDDSDKIQSLIAVFNQFLQLDDFLEILNEFMEVVRTITDSKLKTNFLMSVSHQLLYLEYMVQALEAAEAMSDGYLKSGILMGISHQFLEQGNAVKALEVAKGMIDGDMKSGVLMSISYQFFKQGDSIHAHKAVMAITDDSDKTQAFVQIYEEFLEQEDTVNALEVAKFIPYESLKYEI